MNARRLPWQDLQFFLATAQGGSLAKAAEALGVSSATVHRRLGQLERRLGAQLFMRSPRGYSLTAAGEDLLGHAVAIDAEVLAAERRLDGRDFELTGTVRVSTVDDLMASLLGPVLREFSRRHPGVSLEVSIDGSRADLAQRQADVAVRPGSRPREGDVIAHRICIVGIAAYASPDYLARRSVPVTPLVWGDHPVVRADASLASLPMERYLDRHGPAVRAVLRSDSMLARQTAVREGLGIGLLPCFSADADPGLVRLGAPLPEASAELWVVIHADLRRNARVRSFVEFTREALAVLRPRFEGTASPST